MRRGMLKNPNVHLLLDTHIFLWLINGDSILTSKSLKYIEKIVEEEGGVAISAISLWEISMLNTRREFYSISLV